MFANVFVKRLGILSLLLLSSLAASVSAQVTGFSTYCELRLTGCPQDYDGKALTVPPDVVSLSGHVRACGRQDNPVVDIVFTDAKAKRIVISSAGVKDTTNAIDGLGFTFKRQLPMDTSAITNVSMLINYDVLTDSIIIGGRDTLHNLTLDSLFAYNFTIRRSANPGANWNKDESGNIIFDTDCKTRTLDLQYEGVSLRGREVRGNMATLDIVATDESNPIKLIIEARNANGDILDVENFSLTMKNGKWTYSFRREISASVTPGDGKLQHAERDSIILVYRNPNVPLDSLRVAVPYVSNDKVLDAKREVPNSSGKEAVVVAVPISALTYTFTTGPNPAGKSSGAVSFFWNGGNGIKSGTLSVYDASGNFVKKIPIGKPSGRKVGDWDLTDKKNRPVSKGTYLVRGVVKTSNGKSERVSLVVGVR